MKPFTPVLHLVFVPVLLLATFASASGQTTRTVTTRTSTPETVTPGDVTRTVTSQTTTPGDVTRTVTSKTTTPGDATRTVTTRTSTPETVTPGDVTRTVTTETSSSEAPAPRNVSETVTTRTVNSPGAYTDGDITRTVTTRTTVDIPNLPSRGLFQIEGTSTYFWLDDFGIRHYVRDPDSVRSLYLPNEPVYLVNKHQIRRLPTGRALTVDRGPNVFMERDQSAVLLGKPHVYVEFGRGPTAKRVELHSLSDLQAVEDFDDLEDLTSKFWD